MQTADKLNKSVDTWQKSDSRSVRISRQCKLLGISRSQYYYEPHTEQEQKDFDLLMKIKEVQIEHPYYGYRKIWC